MVTKEYFTNIFQNVALAYIYEKIILIVLITIDFKFNLKEILY